MPEPVAVVERNAIAADAFVRDVLPGDRPVILRGQAASWPAVRAAEQGDAAIIGYLGRFAGGRPLDVMVAGPEIGGRFFYSDDLQGRNFSRRQVPLDALLHELARRLTDPAPAPAIYANSAPAADHVPGWAQDNRLDLPVPGASARLWIGNAVSVATHYDNSANVVVVVAGRRRFTLFPPHCVGDLYVAPLDNTLAGPPVSMPDPDHPDLTRYPRFATALAEAQVAELGPGDALFMPPLWWHNVRALAPLNVMVNYWADDAGSSAAFVALIHAIWRVRDLAPATRAAWRAHFEHFVFGADATHAADHVPAGARGILAPPSPARDARIRGFLKTMLERM